MMVIHDEGKDQQDFGSGKVLAWQAAPTARIDSILGGGPERVWLLEPSGQFVGKSSYPYLQAPSVAVVVRLASETEPTPAVRRKRLEMRNCAIIQDNISCTTAWKYCHGTGGQILDVDLAAGNIAKPSDGTHRMRRVERAVVFSFSTFTTKQTKQHLENTPTTWIPAFDASSLTTVQGKQVSSSPTNPFQACNSCCPICFLVSKPLSSPSALQRTQTHGGIGVAPFTNTRDAAPSFRTSIVAKKANHSMVPANPMPPQISIWF